MSGELAGKVAVVIGATSGIGRAVAEHFFEAGATVFALARRKGEMQHARFRSESLDVTDQVRVETVISAIAQEAPIDVLVYSAGYNVPKRRLGELSPADWDAVVNVNLDGAFYVLRAALPSLRTACGSAIFISSASAAWPNLSGPAYQASKAGLFGLTRAGQYEEHQNGVRFSVILPGVVDTPHLDRRPNPPSPPTRRKMLKPADVAAACLFLAALPARVHVPELHLLPTYLQAPGKTDETAVRS